MRTNVLIAGGGPAAIEAALALHRLAGEKIVTTLLAPESDLTYRPLSVLSPFAAGDATRYPLERMAADIGFTHVRGRLASVDTAGHSVTTVTGEQLAYDSLIVASGARPVEPFAGAITFSGSLTDQERIHGIVQDVEGGFLHRIAFVMPAGPTWPLPLYELALMLAERAYSLGLTLRLDFITPEPAALALFGQEASDEVAALLADAGIVLHTGSEAEIVSPGSLKAGETTLEADRIITLPRLEGTSIAGLPVDEHGFLVIDAHARVQGAADVYAAGDGTSYPVKQGGIACQQADAAAADIAHRAGAAVEPEPFTAVLRGLLVTELGAHVLHDETEAGPDANRPQWWPPAKIVGRELTGYLAGLDEEAGRVTGLSVR